MQKPSTSICLGLALVSVSGEATSAETKADLRGSASLSASNNPLLVTQHAVAATMLEVSAEPSLTRTTPTSSVSLVGRLARRVYSTRYRATTYGSATASGVKRASERLQLNGSATYSRDISVNVYDDIVAAADPRSIRIAKEALVGANLQLSETSSLTPHVMVSTQSYRQTNALADYRTLAAGTGYSRELNERTSFGAQIESAVQDYDGPGRSSVVSLLGTANHKIDEFTTLSGGLGAERVSLSGFGASGDTKARLLLSGNANACRRALRSTVCLTAAVRSDPTGFGGLQRRISTGASLTYQVNRRTSAALNADYQRSKPLGSSKYPGLTYSSVRGSVDYQLVDNITLGGFASYRRRAGIGKASSAEVGAALRFHLGQ